MCFHYEIPICVGLGDGECMISVVVIVIISVIGVLRILVDSSGREARLYFCLPSEDGRIGKGLQCQNFLCGLTDEKQESMRA